jgi:GNAT superfamily N-acetyltransferase
MNWNGYEYLNYTNADVEGIVTIEDFLWGNDEVSRREYFNWKHRNNPLAEKPVGIVAKYEGKVVGFLGYVPAEWIIRDKRLKVLLLCDVVVHPEHRGKGLFASMTKAGMKMYCDEYKFFVAFTSNHMATPGYLKLGWKSIAVNKYMRRLSLLGLARAKMFRGESIGLKQGKFGEIEVSDRIRPDDITRIAGNNYYSENKLYQIKNPNFLEWKLSNPRAKYVYLYHLATTGIDAYIILRVQMNHAHIFDYDQEKGSLGVQKLISFIITHGKFSSISSFHAGMSAELKSFLRKKHFYVFDQIDKIKQKQSYHLPILIRPTKENVTDEDWFINEIDSRDESRWHITEICFD